MTPSTIPVPPNAGVRCQVSGVRCPPFGTPAWNPSVLVHLLVHSYCTTRLTMHYQTVKEDGKTGKDALTYAGNSTRYYNFFRHETAKDYFDNVIRKTPGAEEIEDGDFRVWILRP